MYVAGLTLPKDFLKKVRNGPAAARAQFSADMNSKVRPAVQKRVDDTVARYPGAVSSPFKFSTPRSQRWYFANRKGQLPYKRTGDLGRAWVVTFDRRLSDGQLIIRNISPAARYVYGPGNALASTRQVPGHANTGWGRGLSAQLAAAQDYAIDLMIEAWGSAVQKAVS